MRSGFRVLPQMRRPDGSGRGSRAREAMLPQAAEVERVYRPAAADKHAEADRRTVTVLFADLSGFTALSEQLDPEVMQALQNELFEELTAAVQGSAASSTSLSATPCSRCSARRCA